MSRRQIVAFGTVIALTAGGGLLASVAPASAAGVVATSEGKFLSGSALGINLDTLLALQSAQASNVGVTGSVTDVHPLTATALNAIRVDLGSGVDLLGQNGILTLGAVNQYARANSDGSSQSATGAVTNTGAIGVGGQNGVPQANASLDLTDLLGPTVTGTVANLQLNVGSLSATAAQSPGANAAQTGDYQIAGLNLQLNSPALAGTTSSLRSSLVALQPTVNALQQTIDGLLIGVVTVNGLPQLGALVDSITTVTSADGSIVANLQTGAITIDVAKLLASQGLDLNNLPANTELMPYITTGLTTQLLPAITTALTGLITQITSSLQNLTLTVLGLPVQLGNLLAVVAPVITAVVAPINTVIAGLGTTLITPLASALTGVVSLQANVQERSGGIFTERALRLSLVPGATPLAVVNLGSASVGPNAGPALPPTAASLNPTHGPAAGGTPVTITGTGFDGTSTVTVGGFGPIAPTAVSNDGTTLTFETPAHAAGGVPVVVTTTAGSTDPLTYTYDALVPTATSIAPTHGPAAGNTTVTVNGTGFDSTSTVSIGGFGPITPDTIANNGTSLTFTTPAHAAGDVPVVVTTIGGSTDPLTYTYDPLVPTATSLAPTHGPAAGNTTVTVNGTGFDSTSTVSIGGFGPITPDTIANNGTSLTFTTPAHAAGGVPVVVTTNGGSTDPLTYTYDAAPAVPPTATSLTPTHGTAAGGTTVTVNGTGFDSTSTVSIGGFGPIAPNTIANNGTSLTFETPAHAPGAVSVVVTTVAGSTAPLAYTYDLAAPTAASLTPTHGPTAGGTTVTVSGTGFTPGSTVSVGGGAAITPTSVATDGTSLTFLTPAHAAGGASVVVTTSAGSTAPLTYTFDAPAPGAPSATELNPTHGPAAGGTIVTITGTGFDGTSVVTLDGVDLPASNIAGDGTSLTFETPAHTAGPVLVTVTTDGGTSGPLTYTFDGAAIPAPTATGLTPDHGPAAGNTLIEITGTGFDATSRVTIDGSAPITPTFVSGDGTTLRFRTPAHVAADVAVRVTGATGTTAPLDYTYDPAPAPTATGITPDHGPAAGNTLVTITGTGFDSTSRVSVDGSGPITPTSVAGDGTSLQFRTPAHVAGDVEIIVTGTTGTTDPLDFTYDAAPAPTATGLTPDHGPAAGDTLVTITGTGFDSTSRVSVDGSGPITPTSVSSDGTTLRFRTPAHVAGDVGVVVTGASGSTDPLDFTYDALPAPTATGLMPNHGPEAGNTLVTITGTGFDSTTRVSVDGSGPITPTAVSDDGTTLRFRTPAHLAGPVEVVVSGASGTSDPLNYTYDAPPAPTATGLSPVRGPVTGGTSVTIIGTGFDSSSRSAIDGGDPIIPTAVALDGTSLTFTTPVHGVAVVGVTVTTDSGTTDPLTFTYVPADAGGDPGTPGDGDGDGNGNGNGSDPGNGSGSGVSPAGTGGLALTGFDAATPLALALLLVLVGAAGVGAARWTRGSARGPARGSRNKS